MKKNTLLHAFIPSIRLIIYLISIVNIAVNIAHAEHYNSTQQLNIIEQDIAFLSSDRLKGRAIFTPEIDMAAHYIQQRFKELNLQPLTEKNHGKLNTQAKTFLQSFTLHHVTENTLSVTINGKTYKEKKIAFISNQEHTHWQSLKDITVTNVSTGDHLYDVLQRLNRQGGQHIVLSHPKHQQQFKRFKRLFKKGTYQLSLDSPASILLINTRKSNIRTLNVYAKNTINSQKVHNVIGVLPGKAPFENGVIKNTINKEMIIYSAHYDHLGMSTGNKTNDNIFNGANDNASGVAGILQLAEHYAKQIQPIRRTLVFAAFSAEEVGIYGSKHFANHINSNNVKAMINIEMIGKPSEFGQGKVWISGSQYSNLPDLLNHSHNEQLKEKTVQQHKKSTPYIFPTPYTKQNLFYRSDNIPLARLGVPAHTISAAKVTNDEHYHKVSDELSTLTLTSIQQVVQSLILANTKLINGEQTPIRINKEEIIPEGKLLIF